MSAQDSETTRKTSRAFVRARSSANVVRGWFLHLSTFCQLFAVYLSALALSFLGVREVSAFCKILARLCFGSRMFFLLCSQVDRTGLNSYGVPLNVSDFHGNVRRGCGIVVHSRPDAIEFRELVEARLEVLEVRRIVAALSCVGPAHFV